MRVVPGSDLVAPAHDGATELTDLGWAVVVLEVLAEAGDELTRHGRVVEVVDGAHCLLSVNRP